MSITINENLMSIWFFSFAGGDWMAGVSKTPDGQGKVDYRFRYYKDDKVWDSQDSKHWYEAKGPLSRIEALTERIFEMAQELMPVTGTYVLKRGARSDEEFLSEFEHAPFVHSRRLTEEEFKREFRNLPSFSK